MGEVDWGVMVGEKEEERGDVGKVGEVGESVERDRVLTPLFCQQNW